MPFTAVVGQDQLKLALILAAIEPRLAGVLIAGPRGVAKSTLARGLAAIDTRAAGGFVNLPLGATEEQVVGSLDLAKALGDQEVRFKPGLLARAHGGYLYIDEVNLLADALVDVLLDVAASKTNHVERDGISHAHPARFVLVGTMNPDEGELRPQFSDRFGLCVELDDTLAPATRRAIVDQRLAFEADHAGFVAACQPKETALAQAIEAARQRLGEVTTPEAIKDDIARRCHAAGVEGVRADLHWRQAAVAHAAWQGRNQVESADCHAVEAFVLCHRRTRTPDQTSGGQDPDDEPAGTSENTSPASDHDGSDAEQNDAAGEGDWGQLPPRHVAPAAGYTLELGAADIVMPRRSAGRVFAGRRRGREALAPGAARAGPTGSRIDWFRTLADGARRPDRSPDLVRRPQALRESLLDCVLLDLSASTLGGDAQARARAGVLAIADAAYRARRRFGLLVFGGARIEWLVTLQRAPRHIATLLDAAPAGGGTPLADALVRARDDLQAGQHAGRTARLRTWLITDGRSRDEIHGPSWPGELIVVDTETARISLGRARRLAEALGGRHMSLAELENARHG